MECFNDGITKKKDENENEIMKESVQLSDEDHFENELTLKCIELGEKLSLLLPVFRVAVTTSASINTFIM